MERRERIQRAAWAGAAAAPQRGFDSDLDRHPGAPGSGGGAVDALRAEMNELKSRLAQAAPRRAVVEMDRAITLLHHRVEDMRGAGAGAGLDGNPEDMAYLAEELLALRTSLDAMQAPERFQALSAGVEMLSRKLDILNARAVDPVEMARLQAQSEELKSLVTRAVSGSGLQSLAERLAACAEQVAHTSSETAQRVAEVTSAFERNAEALITRVSAYEASAREEQTATAHELRRDVEAGMHSIHDRLDQVTDYLASLSPAAGAELAERLAQLIDRLDVARPADVPAAAPLAEVVEYHLIELTERFQDAHARLERLDGIEAVLCDVIDEMRRAREASSAVTREAVDVAVDAAVEVAVEAVSRKVSADAGGPAVVGLKRGLAALEARQDEVERRASELLGEALARGLEDRTVELGRVEEDVWAPHAAPDPRAEGEFAGYDPAWDGPFPAGQEAADAASMDAGGAAERYPAEPEPAMAFEPVMERDPRREREPEPDRAPYPETYSETYAEPRIEPEQHAAVPTPDVTAFRADPAVTPRTPKVRRGRRSMAEAQNQAQERRSRVEGPLADRRRPIGARLSPAVIAVTGLAVLAAVSAGAAWTHRDAISARASQSITQIKIAAATPAAPKSTSDLPTPTGPQSLRTAALEGNLAAAYEVGVRFADGVGIPENLDAGIKWLGYAVSRGYAPAAYRLGSLYENTLRNVDEAFRFYKWAAEQGNVRAMHNLAVLYTQGGAGSPDWGEAVSWFRKAANLGLKDSQHNLGIIFARGFSGTSDLTEALTWFNIAARQGDQDSADKRDALAKEADETVLAKARKAADAFVPKPINEAANVVAALPEWNASEAGERMAANTMLFSGNLLASKR
ncbi:hypothetical protein V5F53_03140 [Xanthobacter sp. V4C-4]|uniref:hypothetical protein n=1 Tax=Xanthobacter cornucopiae TaxID=3119924 RepID=UPI00372806D0